MGMHVSGLSPATAAGETFYASVWTWHPLWDYCQRVAPQLCERVEYAHVNDGDGLGAADARALAATLRARLADGHAAAYCAVQESIRNATPDEVCELCGGSGTRTVPIEDEPDWVPEPGECNGCSDPTTGRGTGKVRPFPTMYDVDVAQIASFAAFLETCGGFEIW